jgi:hypothetical protein
MGVAPLLHPLARQQELRRREMTRGLRWLLVVVVFVSIGGSAAAQTPAPATSTAGNGLPVDPALRDDIVRLMDMTGASARSAQMAGLASDAVLNGMRQTQPSVPPRVIEIVQEVLKGEFERAFNGSEIKDKQIALYAKYFTREDVKGMLAFYESDLGKKTIAVMPSLTREAALIGQQWAEANMPRVLDVLRARLKAEGLLPASAPPSTSPRP